jgi:hypothetical protein
VSERTNEPGTPRDGDIIALLRDRDGVPTEVELRSGQTARVLNIAWGYDEGDQYAHLSTNVSPVAEGFTFDSFYTSDIVSIRDAETGATLYPSN